VFSRCAAVWVGLRASCDSRSCDYINYCSFAATITQAIVQTCEATVRRVQTPIRSDRGAVSPSRARDPAGQFLGGENDAAEADESVAARAAPSGSLLASTTGTISGGSVVRLADTLRR